MRTRLGLLLAAGALAFGGAAVAPAELLVAPQSAYAKPCSGGYVHAALPWGHKCLRRGQYCKVSADRAYHRYGYHCHTGRLR